MIDPGKCEFEDSFYDEEFGCKVYYFTYPETWDEVDFCPAGEYVADYGGEIYCMCISLAVYDTGECALAMSPTIEWGDSLSDVDWRDLVLGVNYTMDTVEEMLKRV